MPAHYRVNFTSATNEDLRQTFVITDTAGSALNLTSADLTLAVEDPAGQPVLTASNANSRIVITTPSAGAFELAVPAAVMRTLPPGAYSHDLVLAQAGRTTRIWAGTLTLEDGIAS